MSNEIIFSSFLCESKCHIEESKYIMSELSFSCKVILHYLICHLSLNFSSFTLSCEQINKSVAEKLTSCPLLFSSYVVPHLTWIHFKMLLFNLQCQMLGFFSSSRTEKINLSYKSASSFIVASTINIIIYIYSNYKYK